MDTQKLTITGALESIAKREITPQDLTEACFNQINRLNPTLNAYITIILRKMYLIPNNHQSILPPYTVHYVISLLPSKT